MTELQLSDNEYSLVCLILEEPPMPRAELVRLAARRLFLEPEEADNLVTELLSRDILTPMDGCIHCRISREEADLSAIHRALNTFTPRWPAPNPPPEEPRPNDDTEEDPPREKHRVRPVLLAVCLCAAAIAALWFFLFHDRYPKLTTFEDGRTFSLFVKPESEAQNAAAQYLLDYAREQSWFGSPILRSLELMGMTEYETDASWASQVDAYDSYAQFTGYDIAAEHQGVVIFAEVEVSFTDDAPALSEDGPYLYRIYLSETDGAWTVDEIKKTQRNDDFFVEEEDITVDDRTVTISRWGRTLTGGTCQIYAVTAYDGKAHQLLFLTEEPAQQSSDLSLTVYDLNNDGCEDLMLQGNYQLCYLYHAEDAAFRLAPFLSGRWLQYDPALPGTVRFSHSVEGTTTHYFCRITEDGTPAELARMDIATTYDDGSDITHTYSYYEGGELTETYTLGLSTTEEITDNFTYAMAYLEPVLRWDETILRTAQEIGCLELPIPTTVSSTYTESDIQLLLSDYDENLTVYTSPTGAILLRDGLELFVLPGDPLSICVADCDGDGDCDIFTSLLATESPIVLLNGSTGWDTEPLDLTAIVEDFAQNTAISFIPETGAPDIAILCYSGAYGEDECAFGNSSPDPKNNPAVCIAPGSCTASKRGHMEETPTLGGFVLSFPVYLTDADLVQLTGITYTVTLSFLPEGGWTISSASLSR